jgi:hypothetical protein
VLHVAHALDRHVAADLHVGGEHDVAHPAAAEQRPELVPLVADRHLIDRAMRMLSTQCLGARRRARPARLDRVVDGRILSRHGSMLSRRQRR